MKLRRIINYIQAYKYFLHAKFIRFFIKLGEKKTGVKVPDKDREVVDGVRR